MEELDYGKINIFLLVDIYILYLFKYLFSLLVSRETWSVNTNTIKNQLVSAHCMLVHIITKFYLQVSEENPFSSVFFRFPLQCCFLSFLCYLVTI